MVVQSNGINKWIKEERESSMKIGMYKVHLLFAGKFKLDGGAMFGVVPKVLWEKKKPADEKNRISMCTNLLLLISDKRKILIDTGNGYKNDEKFKQIYGLDYSRGDLFSELKRLNLKPEDITDVVLTHLHFDHAGGTTIKDEKGNVVPTFPNAAYYVHPDQYEWALNPSFKDRASYFPENFVPLKEHGQLKFIKKGDVPFEGIEIIESYGHTPGQLLILVKDKEHPLFYAGDLIPMYPHVAIPWVMAYDNNPLITIEEKTKWLPIAVEKNWIIFFEHDLEIPASFIKKGEKNYEIGQIVSFDE